MLKTEAQLEAEIAALLRKAELIDAQEDAPGPIREVVRSGC
jgi:hypothetical protein